MKTFFILRAPSWTLSTFAAREFGIVTKRKKLPDTRVSHSGEIRRLKFNDRSVERPLKSSLGGIYRILIVELERIPCNGQLGSQESTQLSSDLIKSLDGKVSRMSDHRAVLEKAPAIDSGSLVRGNSDAEARCDAEWAKQNRFTASENRYATTPLGGPLAWLAKFSITRPRDAVDSSSTRLSRLSQTRRRSRQQLPGARPIEQRARAGIKLKRTGARRHHQVD